MNALGLFAAITPLLILEVIISAFLWHDNRPTVATHWDSINYAHEIGSGFFAINSSSLTITVTDVNEPPVITGPTTISFPENGEGVVATYSATDPEGAAITWDMWGSDHDDFNSLNSSGDLTFTMPPDFEGPGDQGSDNVYNVTLVATEAERPWQSSQIQVSVTVTNVNEPPAKPEAPLLSGEEADGHDTVYVTWRKPPYNGGPRVTDYDLQYRVFTTGDNGWTDHPFTGDRPTQTPIAGLLSNTKYEVQVRASNAEGIGEWSDSGEIPTFPKPLTVTFSAAGYSTKEGESATVTVSLDSEADRVVSVPIIVTPQGSTQEADYTVFGLSTGDILTFDAGQDSQTFTIAANQDDDADNETVSLAFGALPSRVSSGSYTQAVLDITDDDGPNAAPMFVDGDSASREVAENSSQGTAIGGPVAATDSDNDPLTYSLTGDDASSFDISTTTGQLFAKSPLDYEARNGYSVVIQVSDLKGPTSQPDSVIDDTVEVSITVTNIDEPPVITGPTTISFPENGTGVVGTYSAADPEGADITWDKWGKDADSFNPLNSTGDLTFDMPPDFESPGDQGSDNIYNVTLAATEDSREGLFSQIEISVTVTNVKELPGKPETPSLSGEADDGHHTISASWGQPEYTGGQRITDYDMQYRVFTTGDDGWTAHPFTGDGTSTTITGLRSNTKYEVQVRGSNAEGAGDWSDSGEITTLPKPLAVTFSAATYDADEGSTTTVTVLLDSEADRVVNIPITATPQGHTQEADYTVSGLSTGDILTFDVGQDSRTFTIAANQDDDTDDEMVKLALGTLPGRVSSGDNAQAVLSINDDDEANAAPIFGDNLEFSVAENSPPGTAIGDPVTATDPDNDPLTYSMTGDDASSFDITTTTGQLIAKAPLDHEAKDEYSIIVQVSDLKGPASQPDSVIDDTVEVSILVIDVGLPGKPDALGAQPASTADGHASLKVSWEPPEDDGGGKITGYDVQYRVLTTDDNGWTDHPFTGDGTSTTITGLRSNTAYEVQVRASNAEGAGDWSDSGEITTLPKPLTVTFSDATYDANEGFTTTVTVLLDSEADRVVSIPITVTPQGSTQEADYTVTGLSTGDILTFVTGDSSKSITISANQDDDTDDEMVKLAFGTLPDRVSTGDNAQAVLSITDDDEPNTDPAFGDNLEFSVKENSPPGTAIGGPVTATDPDDDPLTYSMTGDDASSFDIATTTGQLIAKAPLDHEAKAEYSVIVQVSDLKGPIGQLDNRIDATVEVSIMVTNVNEPPVITGPTTISFAENGTGVVGTYSATDPEGDDISWDLRGEDHDDFTLNSTGDLTFAEPPDFESPGDSYSDNIYNVYNVTLAATEDKTPGLSSEIQISVTVTNVKEPPGKPEAPSPSGGDDEGHHTVSVSWSQPPPTGGPRVTDYDLQYRVFSTGDGPWTDHPFTGDGTSTTITGLMSRTSYEVQVRASNAEGAGDWSESHIFTSLSKPLTVAFGEARYGTDEGESATVTVDLDSETDREVVVAITVTPQGSTEEADYTVSGLSASGALTFATGDSSKSITITASQDNDDADNETVKLDFGPLPDRVSLGSNEWATLVITDDDEPNAPPVFGNSLEFAVTENSPPGTAIGGPVTATDSDDDPLAYSLTGDDAGSFNIATTTGQLTTKAPLDYEVKTRYVVTVQVSDLKNPASHPDNEIDDDAQVAIEIANVGPPGKPVSLEVQPASTGDGHTRLEVSWEAPFGDGGGKITDYDVQYRVLTTDVGPWTHHPFTGDGTSTTIAGLQSITTYEVQVRATSSEGTGDWSDSGEITTLSKPLAVTFSAAGYAMKEGESATVTVALDSEADREVNIPITVTPQGSTQEADYAVSGFSASSTLTFATGDSSKSITITAYQDLDTDNEMVVLAFDALPDRVSSGDNSRAVLSITDDDEPNASPMFGAGGASREVAENSLPGTAIGGPVAATDPEDDPLHYSLTGDDAGSFDIATTTGQLFAKSPLDYEAKAEYSVMVQVTDLKGPIGQPDNEIDDTVEVSIIVNNVGPPGKPVSLEAHPASTADGHASMIVSWEAPEDDGGGGIAGYDLQYRVFSTGDGPWTGHLLTGDNTSTTITGLRSNTTYEVRVRASNAEGAGEWSQSATFISLPKPLAVTFSSARYYVGEGKSATVTVALNSEADRVVSIPITVTPQDSTREADYTISGLSASGVLTFATGDSSKPIAITANQDRDTDDETVALEFGELPDRVSFGRNDRAVLVINDDEEPNAAPVFGRDLEFSAPENSPPGTAIGDPVTATDPEDDPLTYSLGGPHRGFFSIGATTGQLIVEAPLDYEAKNEYSVIVQVSDLKGPTSHPDNEIDDTVRITINIADVDEPPSKPEAPRVRPASTDGHTSLEVSWDEPYNTGPPIVDYDVQYQAGSTGDLTDTNHDSEVTTTTIPGLQPNTAYEVRVRAISAEGVSDWSEFGMGSTNQEPPNNGPTFTDGDSTTRQVTENTPAGVAIGAPITATDPDGDPLTYILGGADVLSFDIGAATGQLITKGPMDYEAKSGYSVIVGVRDGKGGTTTITVTINIINMDEPGAVTLSTASPQVGTELTVSLSDPDGNLSAEIWQWQRTPDGSTWIVVPDTTSAAYTPTANVAGSRLRAVVSYNDGEGAGKSAVSRATSPVSSPAPPSIDTLVETPVPTPVVSVVHPDEEMVIETDEKGATLTFPPNSRDRIFQASIDTNRSNCMVEGPPTGTLQLCVRVEIMDAEGNLEEGVRLLQDAELSLRLSPKMVETLGGPSALAETHSHGGVKLLARHSPGYPWREMPFELRVDEAGGVLIVAASIREFSDFSVVTYKEVLDRIKGMVEPPKAGDAILSARLWAVLTIVGGLLLLAGSMALRTGMTGGMT